MKADDVKDRILKDQVLHDIVANGYAKLVLRVATRGNIAKIEVNSYGLGGRYCSLEYVHDNQNSTFPPSLSVPKRD